MSGASGSYARKINRYLDTPGQTISIILGAIILCIGLWAHHGKGIVYFPQVAPQFADVDILARGNLSVDEIRDIAIEAEQKIIDVEEIERLSVWSNSGGSRGLGRRSGSPDRVGGMFIDFYGEDEAVSDLNGFEIMEVLRDRLKDTSGYIVQVEEEKGGPPIGKPLQLNVSGDNEQLLVAAIGKIRSHLESMGSFIDIEDTTVTRGIEWELTNQ